MFDDDEFAGVSTDFKGTFVVVDCVAVASYSFSDEDYAKAQKLAKHLNDAFNRRIAQIKTESHNGSAKEQENGER